VTDRVGVVLAGGHSRRFGERDKALATLDGVPLLVRAVDRLQPVVDGVAVSCRAAQRDRFAALLADRDVRFVTDETPGEGPVHGLRTTAASLDASRLAVLGCDLPFADPTLFARLFDRLDGATAAVPVADGVRQPTHATYDRRALLAGCGALGAGERSLQALLDALDVARVPVTPTPVRDVDTQAALAAARDRL
jgi:molybdopterin-guanine dinucleotide biosynthesis protein A